MTGPGGLGTGVERFDTEPGNMARNNVSGDWVHITDYAALEAECARLRGKIEEVRALQRHNVVRGCTCELCGGYPEREAAKDGEFVLFTDVIAILDRA